MTQTDEFLKKVAYGDGEKRVYESGVTIYDHGTPYKFPMGVVASALNLSPYENPVTSAAEKLLGFKAEKENKLF
ncbi:MAG: hypothetical protein GTN36_00885 [Candidatus Aenigmarchaeota archaeon]|nr:hypothetical protein [Candidatus Aenigmarchaeota archaeon]